jgi:hypothetical protein
MQCVTRLMAIAVLALACRYTVFEPTEPFHSISPHSSYRALWATTARCISQTLPLKGDYFEDIQWFEVDAPEFMTPFGPGVGSYSNRSRRIYIAAPFVDHPMVVAHEMAHAMSGIYTSHPDDPFKRCRLTWDTYQP